MTDKKNKALFLDRDGIINIDYGYVHMKENFHFVDGIFDLVKKAKSLGYLIIVVTNQAGIAKGFYSEEDFSDLMQWVCEQFDKNSSSIDAVYHCPFHVDGIGKYRKFSLQRKPGPGMLLEAQSEFDIDMLNSIMVGDQDSDVYAGMHAGVGRCILVGSYRQANIGSIEFVSAVDKIRLD